MLAVNFGLGAADIAAGDFDDIGLPPEMIVMEAVANGFESAGWFTVFIWSWTERREAAARLATILGGFLFFDVVTTFVLAMPIPPYFLVWGTGLVILELIGARYLFKEVDDGSMA